MRETRTAQTSIFDFYASHEQGQLLKRLSDVLDDYPQILLLLSQDLIDENSTGVGRKGLSVDSVLRCVLLKQMLGISYKQLSFLLSDSPTYQSFARVDLAHLPSKSSLQWNISRVSADTLESIFRWLDKMWQTQGDIDLSGVRIDSTVVKSNIAAPSDSALLNDAVRVLTRHLATCRSKTGCKLRFHDFRKRSRKLSSAIFYGKKAEKDALYVTLLSVIEKVMKQVERACEKVSVEGLASEQTDNWIESITHYYQLAVRVIEQTKRRVIDQEKVAANEKVVSLFEAHTDIIIKGQRDIAYGHKINLASDTQGLLTSLMIEDGNPSDVDRYLPVVYEHKTLYGCYPEAVVADGGYATIDNLKTAKGLGIRRVVFHKKRGLTLGAMGVKQKTFDALRNFRAGIEGNISELKRAFGLGKALWKGHEGFKSYVWSSALCYNLVRMARIRSG
jgi:IS5 family transposase